MADFKSQIAGILSKATGKDREEMLALIEIPPNQELGDYAFPCFTLAKELRKSPMQIASELAAGIRHPAIKATRATGPYLNFFIDNAQYVKEVLSSEPVKARSGRKIMVEFSQPNTHKEFHVGHLRNVSLGNSICNILEFQGNKVIRANYIGDIGTHVAKAIWCLKKYHSKDKVPQNKGKYLGSIYSEACERIEANPDLEKEVSDVLQKLEAREPGMTRLWKKTRKWSIDEFKRIYNDLNVKFNVYFYESEEDAEAKKIALKLLENRIAKKDQGAIIVNLEEKDLGVAVILKSDGTTLYLTKDLSLAQKKFKEYKIEESVYAVDARQSMHFRQVFEILSRMGFNEKMVHISYEFVSTKQGPISSRKGNVYLYEDLKERLVEKLINETKKRHNTWKAEKIAKNARVIADAALKFGMLRIDNNKEIVFDEDEWLDFDGETGPYVLYTYARIRSIIRKAPKQSAKPDYSELSTHEDRNVLRLLEKWGSVVEEAAKSYKPNVLTRYLLDISQAVNEYYHKHQVIGDSKKTMAARLKLFGAVSENIKLTVGLLGINVLEEM